MGFFFFFCQNIDKTPVQCYGVIYKTEFWADKEFFLNCEGHQRMIWWYEIQQIIKRVTNSVWFFPCGHTSWLSCDADGRLLFHQKTLVFFPFFNTLPTGRTFLTHLFISSTFYNWIHVTAHRFYTTYINYD